ncbi:MAG TPA: hypothetical protein VGF85_06895 [Opitutaceae bacterium]
MLAVLYWNKNTSATSLNAKLAQTNSDNSQLRSELDKANSNVADLRRQLDAGKTQEADITSRLDAAMAAQSALKSDLSKSHSDLTSQQRIAKDQQDALQGQIQQATDETGSLQKQLDQLKSENSDLKSKLADAQSNVEKAQPPAPAKQQEAVPVTATFEKAFFGSRYTLHMKDVGHDTLDVTVSVDGAARPATKIQAGSTLDIGDLKAGQMVMISSEGYQPLSVAVK